jgi:hypothetical protein
MLYKDDGLVNDRDNHSEPEENKPNAYRVADNGIEEKELKRNFLFGDAHINPVREGQPMGGENFGANNVTPSGDDKNNPSQNAGYTNAYFRRTEPSEEHPENSNFKPLDQEGRPDYDKAMPKSSNEDYDAKPDNGDKPKPQQTYQEGTDDNDGENNGKPNIPGPNEVPDQQKVGEDVDEAEKHVHT